MATTNLLENEHCTQKDIDRLALLVLGMHRSGTSAYTRTVSLLGADLPSNLMPPVPEENEKGFWESLDVYKLNDEILESAGTTWYDWRSFNSDWFRANISSAFHMRAADIIQKDFASSGLFVLKDPRICLILPFWELVLKNLHIDIRCLIPFRQPLEVAASLKRRNGFSPLKSQILWLRHVLDAERDSRHMARAFSSYDGLMVNWREEISRISQIMQLAWPRRSASSELEIDAFLDARLRHHNVSPERVAAPAPISEWITETYTNLLLLRQDPNSLQAIAHLDEIRAEFDRACSALGAVIKEEELVSGGLKSELINYQNQLRELGSKLEQREDRIAEISTTLSQRDEKLTDLVVELAARDAQLAELRETLSQRDEKLSDLLDEIASRDAELDKVREDLGQCSANLSDLTSDLSQKNKKIGESSKLLAERQDRIDEITSALEQREAAQIEISNHLHKTIDHVNRLKTNLDYERRQVRALVESRGQCLVRLSQLQQSPSWQFNRPLQAIEKRWPGLVSGAAGLTKFTWWGVSLRLPERLRLRRLALKLLEKKLFDTDWYIARNPDIVLNGLHPLMHWLVAGWRQQRDPCPLFDMRWYLQQQPEIAREGINPLLHYLEKGADEGLSPHPLFDIKWYLHRNDAAADESFNPLVHYMSIQPSKSWDPHPLFDTCWYLDQDPGIENKAINALYHYLVWGGYGWLNPNPFFDSAWYLEQYPEVAREGLNPLVHYVRWGADEGKDPCPIFDTSWYLEQHPEVATMRINPLAHFIHHGKPLGWAGHPAESAARSELRSEITLINAGKPDEEKFDVAGAQRLTDISDSHTEFVSFLRASQRPGPFFEEEGHVCPSHPPLRVIAFYLPQFHPIPENDTNWGKGFTEWTNTCRALPAFPGHYQPRAPGELGYYDLRNPEVQRRQMAMAKSHGISAFCYHHYWFNGKKVLRRPIDTHLADSTLDLPFCINWANEPWTACWDGHRESGVLLDQTHSPEDDLAFIRDIEPFLRDKRYVRVEGKPLLSIYRPTLFPNIRATLDRWQNYCVKEGVGELYIAMVQSFEIDDPRQFGFDAAIEFPPHNVVRKPAEPGYFFYGANHPQVWSYAAMARGSMDRCHPGYDWFRGLTLCWDNTPRKSQGWVFKDCDPGRYGEWLESHCRYAIAHLPPDRRLIFINAWNEWAEGTYLEPDQHFGYAFLNRTGEVLAKLEREPVAPSLPLPISPAPLPSPVVLGLPEYVEVRHGRPARDWLTQHFVRFGLPYTAEEAHLLAPTEQEIAVWMADLVKVTSQRSIVIGEEPKVSILLPVFNQVRFTLSCLISLYTHMSRHPFEVLIGDDLSSDATTIIGQQNLGGVRYFRHQSNLGFLKNCNTLAEAAKGSYLVLLNNDTVILPGWLDGLIDTLERNQDIGLVGSKLIYPDGRLQEAGSLMWDDASGLNWGNLCDPQDPEFNYRRDVDYCSGASIALATSLWKELGGFDAERYHQAYYEDTDLAFRIREEQGLRVIYQPLSHLIHFEGISSGRSLESGIKSFQKTNRPLFLKRWRHALRHHGKPGSLPNNYFDRRPGKELLLIDVVTPLPDQDSGSVDTYNYLRIFDQLGFKVTFLPVNGNYKGPYVRDLQGQGIRVLHDPYRGAFEDTLRKEASSADVIFIYRETAHRYMSLLRAFAPNTPIVFNTVDLHFLRKEREAELLCTESSRLEALKTRQMELAAMDLANATIILSQYEEELLTKMKPGVKLARIPIVREISGRSSLPYEERHDVVFIGGFLHAPNVDAVRYFVHEVWPEVRKMRLGRPCRFLVAGSNIPEEIAALETNDIIIKGHIADLNDLYDRALISVAPLRYGAGLKGKVVTSLSYGVPVVGTSISLEGSGLVDGQHILKADSPAAMAAAIGRLHADRNLWYRISDAGLAFTQDHFSLDAVKLLLVNLLGDLGVLPN